MIKSVLLAAAVLATATGAQAVELVTNGSFESVASTVTKKTTFLNHVTGWSGGSNLTFIDYPGTADDGSYLSVYGPFPNHSPDGGKFVEADGAARYSSAITQNITGLTAGKTYTLKFFQAAGQQSGFKGSTTERWQVRFGIDTQLSSQFSLPEAGVGPWQAQTLMFTAHATHQVLSFLALGTPDGQPPISFLDGVSLQEAVPEPATWALLMVGFGLVGVATRRRQTVTVTA
jgi:hypothetical protein